MNLTDTLLTLILAALLFTAVLIIRLHARLLTWLDAFADLTGDELQAIRNLLRGGKK